MNKRTLATLGVVGAVAIGGASIANASSSSQGGQEPSSPSAENEAIHAPDASGSRLDDGADLLSQAKITEAEAIKAAQTAATGPLNEVDLEDYQGHLVFNVDVGSHDVKVDASNGNVLAAPVDE